MLRDDAAQGLVEYAIILALIAVVALVTLRVLGKRVDSVFGCTAQDFEHKISSTCGSGGRL